MQASHMRKVGTLVVASTFDAAQKGLFGAKFPYFDRLVIRSGHNLGPVRGKRHRADPVAVGAQLFGLELERGCEGRQERSV